MGIFGYESIPERSSGLDRWALRGGSVIGAAWASKIPRRSAVAEIWFSKYKFRLLRSA